jgi:hypothetical protein
MSNRDSVPPTTAADFIRAWKFAGAPTPTKAQVARAEKATGQKTRRIAGHSVTLTVGVRYVASRPGAEKGRGAYPVTISRWPIALRPKAEVTIPGLSYEKANAFVNAFNNGDTSFDGRVW